MKIGRNNASSFSGKLKRFEAAIGNQKEAKKDRELSASRDVTSSLVGGKRSSTEAGYGTSEVRSEKQVTVG